MAVRISLVEAWLTVVSATYPVWGASSVGEATDRLWICARVSLNSMGAGTPTRLTVSTTALPAGPRSVLTAWSDFHPSVDLLSMAVIWSPVWIPARSAGVSGSGATTVIQPSRTSIWMPRPP